MAIESGFFNSVNRDRVYDARWFAQYFASFIGNGVFPNPSTGMQVTAGENLTTIVRTGKGWINGYFISNDSDYVLQHDVADGLLKRIDRVVMRLDYLARSIDIYVKKGTFSSNPSGPSLQRDDEAYELSLADVLINNGDIEISQSRITDTRMDNNLCGIVHGVVNQVDTTTIFNQYLDALNNLETQSRQEFEDFLNDLRDILDGDVAGNLTLRILDLENNKLDKSSVGIANGVAPLDSNNKLPLLNLPSIQGIIKLIASQSLQNVSVIQIPVSESYDYYNLVITDLRRIAASGTATSLSFIANLSNQDSRPIFNVTNVSSSNSASASSSLESKIQLGEIKTFGYFYGLNTSSTPNINLTPFQSNLVKSNNISSLELQFSTAVNISFRIEGVKL